MKRQLLHEEKVKGIVIRARAPWQGSGEKSTKYFLNLDHVKWFNKYRPISDTLWTKKILSKPIQNEWFCGSFGFHRGISKLSLNTPKVSEEQRQSCEGRITTEECRTIIETFQNNKSPGNDGLPIDLISEPFIDCVNEKTGGHFVCACVNTVCWSTTEAFSVNCLRSLSAFAGCFLELTDVYWVLRSSKVFLKVSRHFYDESEFIVASLSPLRGQSFLS